MFETGINYIGYKFGKLEVIEKTENRHSNGEILWLCQCECGNMIEVRTSYISKKSITNCGCKKIIDLTNQKFGKLTAIKPLDENFNRYTEWLCECKCGNTTIQNATKLRQAQITSCGCLKKRKIKVGDKNEKDNNYIYSGYNVNNLLNFFCRL